MSLRTFVIVAGLFLIGIYFWPRQEAAPVTAGAVSKQSIHWENAPSAAVTKLPGGQSQVSAPAAKTLPDRLADIQTRISQISEFLKSSGLMEQIRAGQLSFADEKRAAQLIAHLTDLRSREIEIRLAQIKGELQ
jgi:hypothetical protein